ncbi:MAG TPA: amino acid permease [Actinomycetota bacterium]
MSERQRTTGAAAAAGGRREPGGLRRREAIPLAIGSVAGSGILFLPSAVYVEAGRNSLLVWLLSTALCLPMLLMFQDMVRADPGGDGIQAFVRAGLGEVLGRCVPLLFVSLVIVGLPAGALVAGRYLARAVGAGEAVTVLAALAVLLAALAVNLAGVRASTRVQHAGIWALVAMALVLLGSAAHGGRAGLSTVVTPDAGDLGVLLPGVVLAMWTFAGFENLTFLSRELRRPERDFLPVSATALGLYGLLTVLLTVAIAVRVPRGGVDQVVGLLQLARTLRPRQGVVAAVTVIALGATALNTVAWVWGVSRLIARAAAAAILPRALARSGQSGVPQRAVLLLGGLFAVTLTVLVAVPGILVDAVAAASAIFIVLYLLCIVSYLRVRGLAPRPLANLLLLPPLAGSLVQSGWRSLYGAAVLLAALAAQLVRRSGGV